ncbi:MAG: hypothetical protein KC933_24320 [Myxococcales bacterium]|nr:hypothetical protein [Myxococcales bacterium]MCB9651173.1 hypothetical protein [Deltaproteobacteria bacterium]
MLRKNCSIPISLAAVAALGACSTSDGPTETSEDAVGPGIDLVVESITGPASAMPYAPLALTVKVCNRGDLDAWGADLEVYLSADNTITPSFPFTGNTMPDPLVGPAWVPQIPAGGCVDVPVEGPAAAPNDGAYYLGAVVDPWQSVPEADEGNNITVGPRIGVGYGPNLVVEAISGPPSAHPFAPIAVDVTVCNRGTAPAWGFDLTVYLSEDATLEGQQAGPYSDPMVGPGWGDLLDADRCEVVRVEGPAAAFAEVPHFLGAIVDEWSGVPELIEDDNAFIGPRIGIGFGPNLVVRGIEAPPSATPGATIEVAVELCNTGTEPAFGADVSVYLSTDTTLEGQYAPPTPGTTPDFLVGQDYLQDIEPGACLVRAITGPAAVWTPGAYYVGAIADEYGATLELMEDDNTFVGARVGVGYDPDLVITAIEAPASARPYDLIELGVTVCNQGTSPAGYVEVTTYASADGVVQGGFPGQPGADPLMGFGNLSGLEAGECRRMSISGPAAVPTEGVYYLGAIVDAMDATPELIEDNNAFVGPRLGVGNGPDLVVAEVATPASAMPGTPIDVAVTVCNQGTDPGYAEATLFLTETAGARPGPMSPYVGFVPGGPLEPGQCRTEIAQAIAAVPQDGVYFVTAVADELNAQPELREDNNLGASAPIGIGFGPDLVIDGVVGPPSARPGDLMSAQVVVCNQGTAAAWGTEVTLYLSADETLQGAFTAPPPGGDPMVAQAWLQQLEAGRCTTLELTGPAWTMAPGPHFLGAIVDEGDSTAELREDNNSRLGDLVGVGFEPDLVVAAMDAPAAVRPGEAFTVDVRVCNQGTVAAPSVDVELTLDATVPGAFPVGNGWGGSLSEGACLTVSVPASAPVPQDGVYALVARVDPWDGIPELREDNNAASVQLPVGFGPNLVVEALSAPANALPGGPIEVEATVCNRGTDSAPGADLEIYLSADRTLDGIPGPYGDALVGQAYLPLIPEGECVAQVVQGGAWVPEPGTYLVAAWVDPHEGLMELVEDDNQTFGARVGIGFGPDLVISEVSAPASVMPGAPMTVDVTVCNQGTAFAPGADVALYLSEDTTLDGMGGPVPPVDAFAGQAWVPGLPEGQCQPVTVQGWAGVPHDGVYHLAAVVDEMNTQEELQEDNNVTFAGVVGVGFAPDLVVQGILDPGPLQMGPLLTVQVEVCNQGTVGPVDFDLTVYFSADAELQGMAPPGPPADLFFGQVWVSGLDAGQCRVESVQGPLWLPEAGAYYVGAVVDEYEGLMELNEANNVAVAGPVTVAF